MLFEVLFWLFNKNLFIYRNDEILYSWLVYLIIERTDNSLNDKIRGPGISWKVILNLAVYNHAFNVDVENKPVTTINPFLSQNKVPTISH